MFRLYCIPRTDMVSMNMGRIAAQVSHASTQVMDKILKCNNESLKNKFNKWLKEGDGFGTTIVLKPSSKANQKEEFDLLQNNFKNLKTISNDLCFGIVIDPEYFERDEKGKTKILKNVHTCFYVFGNTKDIKKIIGGNYELL